MCASNVVCSFSLSLLDLEGGQFFFHALKEGDNVLFACDDENESHLWVMALYRATGQSHKPTPPTPAASKSTAISKIQGGKYITYISNTFLL
jgi:hypothetical protein